MPKYSFCNLALESDIPFAELQPIEDPEPEYRIKVGRGASDDRSCEWLQKWSGQDDKPWLLLGRQAGGYFLRFPGLADFVLSHDAKEIHCHVVPDTPTKTVRHLILDQVMPLLLSRHGRLVLHGSAVSTPQGAIAFIGQTGWGKSTLAASFSEHGMAVLTDDCLLLQQNGEYFNVIPSYPGVRLWPDTALNILGEPRTWTEVAHYTEKKRLAADAGIRFSVWPTALLRVYFLSAPKEGAKLRVEPLTPRETMLELVRYSYLIDATDRLRLRQEFERLARFALKPLFYRLAYPHDFSQLAQVRRAIIRGSAEYLPACADSYTASR